MTIFRKFTETLVKFVNEIVLKLEVFEIFPAKNSSKTAFLVAEKMVKLFTLSGERFWLGEESNANFGEEGEGEVQI